MCSWSGSSLNYAVKLPAPRTPQLQPINASDHWLSLNPSCIKLVFCMLVRSHLIDVAFNQLYSLLVFFRHGALLDSPRRTCLLDNPIGISRDTVHHDTGILWLMTAIHLCLFFWCQVRRALMQLWLIEIKVNCYTHCAGYVQMSMFTIWATDPVDASTSLPGDDVA